MNLKNNPYQNNYFRPRSYEYLNPENFDKNWKSIIKPALSNMSYIRKTHYDKEPTRILYWTYQNLVIRVIPKVIVEKFGIDENITTNPYKRYRG